MVDRELIQRRLARLGEYLAILRELARTPYDQFAADPKVYGSAERFLQLSIELVTDLGNHVIADEGLGAVARHGDVPGRLAEKGIVDAQLAHAWVQMIAFQNVLVHEYMGIDRQVVHRNLRERLEDFETLRQAFARL